jgi:Pin2-interacting protein X1
MVSPTTITTITAHVPIDASRFGLSYLSKFGWDASQGLGSSGDGMRTHIKVEQKLDMMGIGAQHQRDPNGIAWKQNKEFEALLKRLNESAEQEERVEESLGNESSVTTKKRKHKDGDDPDASENQNTRKKEKEKRQKSSHNDSATPAIDPTSEPSSALFSSKPQSDLIPKSRPMA